MNFYTTVAFLVFLGVCVSTEAITITPILGGLNGTGTSTRYWDCCKPACAWGTDIPNNQYVASCAADGVTELDNNEQSGCDNGTAYACSNQQPFVVNSTFGFGFSGASFTGHVDTNFCCSCFLLKFVDQIWNKRMVVQIINSGELDKNQFTIALPGSGVGPNPDGCHNQWNAPWTGWGNQNGGVHSRSECLSLLPKELQEGCTFRFDFMETANNPTVEFQEVVCPDELVKISGCSRT